MPTYTSLKISRPLPQVVRAKTTSLVRSFRSLTESLESLEALEALQALEALEGRIKGTGPSRSYQMHTLQNALDPCQRHWTNSPHQSQWTN